MGTAPIGAIYTVGFCRTVSDCACTSRVSRGSRTHQAGFHHNTSCLTELQGTQEKLLLAQGCTRCKEVTCGSSTCICKLAHPSTPFTGEKSMSERTCLEKAPGESVTPPEDTRARLTPARGEIQSRVPIWGGKHVFPMPLTLLQGLAVPPVLLDVGDGDPCRRALRQDLVQQS